MLSLAFENLKFCEITFADFSYDLLHGINLLVTFNVYICLCTNAPCGFIFDSEATKDSQIDPR